VCVCVWVCVCVLCVCVCDHSWRHGYSMLTLNVIFKLHLGRQSINHFVNRFLCQAVYRSVDVLLLSALFWPIDRSSW